MAPPLIVVTDAVVVTPPLLVTVDTEVVTSLVASEGALVAAVAATRRSRLALHHGFTVAWQQQQ